MPILATRGCPYQCTFCSSPAMWTTRYHVRDASDIVDDIASSVERYRVANVDFCDLTAIIKRDWILAFCASSSGASSPAWYQLPSGARSEALDGEVQDALARTGCGNIWYAPESGSPRTLARTKKKIRPERMVQSIRAVKQSGIVVKAKPDRRLSGRTRREIWETVPSA